MPDHPQVHQPHHFYLAWAATSLAVGRNTGKETCDHTTWIEGHDDRTIFHASNIGTYVRCVVPTTQPGSPDPWREIVFDPFRRVKDIATESRRANPQQQDFDDIAAELLITPTPGEAVRFELHDTFAVGSFAATIPALDLEWPYEIISILDNHETDPTAEMAWPPASAAFIHGIGKLVGRTIPVRLNNLTATFDVTHPDVPEVRISGAVATKAT